MSQLNVDNIRNRTGSNGGPNFPSGITVAVGQTAYIHGNLQVDGTETIINTETLNVSDKTVGIGSTTNASNTTADGAGIEVFASSSQTGNNKTLTWGNTANSWEFGPNDVGLKVGTGVTVYGGTGIVSATSFKGDGSQLTGIDATAIQTGNTSVQTVDTGSDGHVKMTTEGGERVRVGPAGQIGLGGANYGSSGQVLKSGGSAAAPTWGDAGGAGEFDATADGAISAGNPIILTANGKVQKVEETTSYTNPIADGGSSHIKEGHSQNNCFISMPYSNSEGSGQKHPGGVAFYNDGGSGDIQYYRPFTYSSGSLSFTGNVNYRGNNQRPICSHYNDTSKRGVLFYNNSSNTATCNVIQADNIDGGSVTLHGGGGVISGSYNVQEGFSCHDPSIDRDYLFGWRSGNNARLAIGKVTASSASWIGTSLDIGFAVKDQYMGIAAGGGKVMISYRRADNNNICVKVGTWVEGSPTPTNDSITWGSELAVTSGAGTFNAVVYDRTAERFILAYCPDEASGKAAVISVSGNTCTKEAEVEFESQEAIHIALAYSPTIKRSVVAWVDKDDTYKARVQSLSVSGNTVSLVSTPLMFNNYQTYNWGFMGGDTYGVLQLMDNVGCNRMFCGVLESGNKSRLHAFEVGAVTGNVNSQNFIGFNKTAVADGETAKVQTTASVLTGQSGLTTTSPYFLQRNGTIGLSTDTTIGSIKVGVGIATDKLLIKGF